MGIGEKLECCATIALREVILLNDAAIWITAQAGILAAEVFFVSLYVQRQYDIEDESRRYGEKLEKCLRVYDSNGADDTLRQFISYLRSTNPSRKFEEIVNRRESCQPVLPVSIRQISPAFPHKTLKNGMQNVSLGILGAGYVALWVLLCFRQHVTGFVWPGHPANMAVTASLFLLTLTVLIAWAGWQLLRKRTKVICDQLEQAISAFNKPTSKHHQLLGREPAEASLSGFREKNSSRNERKEGMCGFRTGQLGQYLATIGLIAVAYHLWRSAARR
jgi:hypothetical protein